MRSCIYFEEIPNSEIHTCFKFDRCKLKDGDADIPSCNKCKQKLLLDDKDFLSKWEDPVRILDRKKNPTDSLRNLLAGTPAFLIGGGPSSNDLPLEELSRRGVWSMGINNVAAHPRIRPQAFVCSDPPMKFSHSIWLDPGIMKFVPIPKLSRGYRGKVRQKTEDGSFVTLDQRTEDCPNVWAFKRESWFTPTNDFFLTDGVCWGNHKSGVAKTGREKVVCTMFLGMRLLRYLGCSKLFLLGVDFLMADGYGYSFNQARDADACNSNNEHYLVVNKWLCEMQAAGVFERFGMPVYNCFERSGLRAFPYVPFDEAVDECCGIVEREPNISRFYEKVDK